MPNRVLIAEDDTNLRETLSEVLKGAGYEVMPAQNGDVAVKVYDEMVAGGDPPVAVVVDLLLPKIAGFDVIKQLKAKGAEMPFFCMSGVFKGAGHQEEASKLGAAGFLVKPFDNDALVSQIDKAVGPAALAAAGPASVDQQPLPSEGTLLENPVLHLLWRAERELHSGVLEVFTPKGRGRVFVFRGQCTLAQHWAKTLNLGFHLVKSGSLTPEMYQEVVGEACERSSGIYDVIKGKGWVREGEIKDAYKKLVPQIIRRMVAAQGNFRWIPTEDFAKLMPAASTKIFDVLIAGVRESKADDLSFHVNPRAPLRLAPGDNWEAVKPHLEKACGSSSLERAINGRANIAQLLSAARNDDDKLMRMRQIFLLMSTQSVQASMDVIKMANPPPEEPARAEPAPAVVMSPSMEGPAVPAPFAMDGSDDADADAGIDFNAAEQSARERVRIKWDQVRGKDYWTVLGVARDADPAALKKAYFALAREYHADAFSGLRLGATKATLDQLFALIAQAHDTLSNPQKRGEYEASQSVKESGMSTDIGAIFAAEHDFDKGRLLLERGELTAAAKFFEKALPANPQNAIWEAHTIFSQWWVTRDPQKGGAIAARLEAIYRSSPENPQFLDVLYFLGRLLCEIGQDDRGRKVLKKVLSEKPDHQLAQRDIRHMQKKADDAAKADKAGAGLMGRFLKR